MVKYRAVNPKHGSITDGKVYDLTHDGAEGYNFRDDDGDDRWVDLERNTHCERFEEVSDGPVRTVIVDGLYGIVAVYHEQDQVRVTLTREDGTPDQPEAAARTLQQLAEALREG